MRKSKASEFTKKSIGLLLSFVLIVTGITALANTKTFACEVVVDGRSVGIVATKEEAQVSEYLAKTQIEGKITTKAETTTVFVDKNDVQDVKTVSKEIVLALPEVVSGFGVYAGDDVLSAFKSRNQASDYIKQLKKKISKNETATLKGLKIEKGNYEETLFDIPVEKSLNSGLFTYEQIEKKVVKFSTKEKKDFSLPFGTRKVVNKGKNGREEIKIQYTRKGKELLEKKILSVRISTRPKEEVVIVGTKRGPSLVVNKGATYACPVGNNSYLISSKYGEKRAYSYHHGIDFAVGENTTLFSAMSGTVVDINLDESDTYGKFIVIKGVDGLFSIYGHLNDVNVTLGQKVLAGEFIGLSGNTGHSTGPHLHFEVRTQQKVLSTAIDSNKLLKVY